VKNAGLGEKYDVDDMLVIYDDFAAQSMERASWQLLQHDKKHLMSEFSDIGIWDIVQSDFSAKIVNLLLTLFSVGVILARTGRSTSR
jgi:hypothetical protein